MPLLIIFIILPIAEVYTFITVGGEIGVFKTLLLCVLTALIGGFLVRQQGVELLIKAQSALRGGNLPVEALFDGVCIVISGILLLTPGFVTDIMGFSLLIPPFRQLLRKIMLKYGKFNAQSQDFNKKPYQNNDDIIEGQYQDISNDHEKLEK